jgi:hypothetical protein
MIIIIDMYFHISFNDWNFSENKQGKKLSLIRSNQLFMPKT